MQFSKLLKLIGFLVYGMSVDNGWVVCSVALAVILGLSYINISWIYILLLSFFIYVIYYLAVEVRVPDVYVADGPLRSFLESKVPILKQPSWPLFICVEPRAQMVLSAILRRGASIPDYDRELIALWDGGEIALDWLLPPHCFVAATAEPICVSILLPGLTGDSRIGYMRTLVHATADAGSAVAVFNHRGLGGVPLKTCRTFCATDTKDLVQVVKHVRNRFPTSKLVVVGVSLGAMILGRYLLEGGDAIREDVTAAMLISAAWDVPSGLSNLQNSYINREFLSHFAKNYAFVIRRDRHVFEGNGPWDMDSVIKSRWFPEMDDQLTAPLFGYKDSHDYYCATSLGDNLQKLRVPTLALCSYDDPFQPPAGIPLHVSKASPHLAITVTKRGGHVAFLEGFWPKTSHFMERTACEYINAVIHFSEELNSDYNKNISTNNSSSQHGNV